MKQENLYFRISEDQGITWKSSSNWDTGISILNIKMEKGLYSEELLGSRSLIETSISGRSSPYFYGIKKEPLSFELTLAIVSEETTDEVIDNISKYLIKNEYMQMQFYDDKTDLSSQIMTYDVIANGSCKLDYLSDLDKNKYMAFLTINFRCASHSGYKYVSEDLLFTSPNDIIEVDNPGFEKVYPNLTLTFGAEAGYVKIFTEEDETNFFAFYHSGILEDSGETSVVVTVNMCNRTITRSDGEIIYSNWGKLSNNTIDRKYLYLDIGSNIIKCSTKKDGESENQSVLINKMTIECNAPCIT